MRFEIVEDADEWIVRSEGAEIARFATQETALLDVAERLRGADNSQPSSVAVRYQSRAG